MKLGLRGGVSFLALLGALSGAAPGHAAGEPHAEQAARAAFEAGRELASAGNYREACSKFEESRALVDAIGTTYNLADCEEHRGHFARAQNLFSRVAERAHQLDQPEREQAARARASALDARLSLLAIEGVAPGTTLSLDGQLLSTQELQAPIAIEPGKHRLSASAEGKRSWSKQLDVPRARLLIGVSVPKLRPTQPARAPTPPSKPLLPPTSRRRRSAAPALIVASVGVSATAAGALFGWRYLSKNSDAKALCPSGYGCPRQEIAEHKTLVDQARASRNFAYVGFGVGAAALTSAVVLYLTRGDEGDVSASAGSNDGAWKATLQGRF